MIKVIKDELVPIIIVVDLLAVWTLLIVTGQSVPDTVDILVTAIVSLYFGGRQAGAAVARALNGKSSSTGDGSGGSG